MSVSCLRVRLKCPNYEEELAQLAAILEQLQRETINHYEEKEEELGKLLQKQHRLAHEQHR